MINSLVLLLLQKSL